MGLSGDYWLMYCPEHKKPYTTKSLDYSIRGATYYGKFEVEEDGTPVGYVKEEGGRTLIVDRDVLDFVKANTKSVLGSVRKRKAHKKHAFKKQCIECGHSFKGNIGLGIHKAKSHK